MRRLGTTMIHELDGNMASHRSMAIGVHVEPTKMDGVVQLFSKAEIFRGNMRK